MKHHSTLFIIFSTLISSIVGCNEQLGLQESDYASFDATSVQVQKASSSAVRVFWTPFAARGQVDISYAVHLRKVDGSQSFDAEILSKFRAESFSTDQGEVWQLPIADETLRNHLIGLTPALVSTSAAGNERLDYAEDMSGSVFAVTIVPKFGGESRTADATSTTLLFGLGASARFPGFTSAEASGSSGIKLSWDAIESVNKYEIYQYKLSNVLGTNDLSAASTETAAVNFDLVGVKVKLHNLKANQFSIVQPTKIATIENQNFFEISDIPLDKFNVYEVRPHGQSISGNTNFAEVYILEKPMTDFAGLEDIVLNYSTGAITLNWTAASDSAVTGYNIYRGTDFAELIATVEKPATSYVHSSQDSSILLGVKAKDQFGHEDANVVMLQGGGQGLTNAGSSSAQLEVSPDGFDFGEVIVGQSSATKVFTILNKGDAVILTTMTSSKPTQAVITEDNCVGISLAKDSTCTVSVYFVPSALGLINASLTAEYAPQIAGIDSNVSFAVKATGVTELTTFLGVTGASNVGHDSVDLTWVDDSKALSYLIYSQTGSGDNITLTKLATLDASASSNGYTLTGLTAQTDYLLRVYAQTQAGTLATNEKTVSFTTTVAVTLASLDNHIFPSSPANVGDTKSYDANNTDDSGETNTTYTCFYDNDIDGSLASGASACSTITGVSLDAQFSSNGRLSWVIDSSSAGKAYELHFTATMGNGSDTAISKVNVSYGHDRTNVVFESDASFANSYSPCHYQNNWGDAPNLTSAAALSSTMTKSANFTPSTSSGCAGAGTTADPYRFVFDGTNDKFSLTGMDDETGMLFAGWVKVSDLTDGGTIFSNGTSTLGAGVRLEQTYVDGRSYFVYTVGGLNVYSDTKSAMLANSPVVYYQLGTSNGGDDIPNIGTLGGTHDGLNSIIPSLGVSGLAQNTVTDTAFYFDGGRTIAEAYSTYAHVTGSRTLEAYFKADEVDRTAYIAGFGLDNLGNLALGIDNGKFFCKLEVNKVFVYEGEEVVPGVNYHAAVAINPDSDTFSCYLNGFLVGDGSNPNNSNFGANASASILSIGQPSDATQFYSFEEKNGTNAKFKGVVDEVGLYTSELTGAQLLTHYNPIDGAQCGTLNPYDAGEWVHIAAGYKNNQGVLYINGTKQCTFNTNSNGFTSGNTTLNIGAHSGDTDFWKGAIGNFTLYSTSANYATVIADHYEKTKVKYSLDAMHPYKPLMLAWLDASDLDADGSTADQPSNNSVITQWIDKTKYGSDVDTIGGTPRYMTSTTSDSVPAVRFTNDDTSGDGNSDDDYVMINQDVGTAITKYATTIFVFRSLVAGKAGASAGMASWFSLGDDGNRLYHSLFNIYETDTTSVIGSYTWQDVVLATTAYTPSSSNDASILVIRKNGGTHSVRLDGVNKSSDTTTNYIHTNARVGKNIIIGCRAYSGNAGTGECANIDVYEAQFYDSYLSDSELSAIETVLSAKWQ